MKPHTLQVIEEEIQAAKENYGPFNSTHEAYAVLQEEVNEFWELVQKDNGQYKEIFMYDELKQVAAVAIRIMEDLEESQIKWV